TLTEADIRDHGVEITTFTNVVPKAKEGNADGTAQGITPGSGQIEWLSDEFAEEFGEDFGTTISVQTDISALTQKPAEKPAETPEPALKPDQPTPNDAAANEAAKQEMLRRATVKADTLPSEHKSFQGDRPKPIDTLMRSPGKPASNQPVHHATVSVPIEDGPAPKMFIEEDDGKIRERSRGRTKILFALVALVCAGAGAVYFATAKRSSHAVKPPVSPALRGGVEATAAAREAVAIYDLEGAKNALGDLELEPGARSEASTYLAQAVVKKEFLYDVEGAMLALQTARQQARDRRTETEIDNLMAVYNFEHDPASSVEMMKSNLEAYKDDPVYRYNYALGLLRTGKQVEAVSQLDGMISSVANDPRLLEDAALAQAWAIEAHCSAGSRDSICKRGADAEDGYLRALAANPNSAKARLGLALFRLRRSGIKASESDFRAFVDLAPELDPFSRMTNFRELGNGDFYAFAHSQIVDLNTPSQNMNKPSALIMAADAIVSCLLGRNSDAGKILEGALTSAPGDVNVLKALGYLRWKDGQMNELVDVLKDLRDRNSFALNFMLGKAYSKLRRRDLAEKYFRNLVDTFPARSEGLSLLGDLMIDQPDKADEAKTEFQLALKKDPLDLVAWRGLQKLNAAPPLSSDLLKNIPF
ncbi:MAG: tetratricopeptide repeat protein, partial [Bdellovibrionota bacterium]